MLPAYLSLISQIWYHSELVALRKTNFNVKHERSKNIGNIKARKLPKNSTSGNNEIKINIAPKVTS